MTTFADLGLSEPLLQALSDVGYETPSPIQEQAIPPLLEGLDVIGQAQTGSGKTAAFGLPLLQYVDPEESDVQGLVLWAPCPSGRAYVRELRAFRLLKQREGHGAGTTPDAEEAAGEEVAGYLFEQATVRDGAGFQQARRPREARSRTRG